MNRNKFVIIGGSAAGMTAATRLRRVCPEASIIVVEKGPFISYAACGLPYFISGHVPQIEDLILYSPEGIFDKYKIDVRTGHEAVTIFPRKRSLEIRNPESGSIYDLDYDKLILATGAIPVIPDIPGRSLENVVSLRDVNDAISLRKKLESGIIRKAVIVGTGYLGLELAEALRHHHVDILMIEAKAHIMDPFELEIASLIKDELLKNGCQIHKSVTVEKINGVQSTVRSVVLSNGAEVAADMVLFAAGVSPEVRLARECGIELGKSGAIRVNPKQETSVQNIYAIGDCVEVKDRITGKYQFAPLATAALKQARVAADNACGTFSRFEGTAGTALVKLFNLEIGRTGIDKVQIAGLPYPVDSVTVKTGSRAAYYPGSASITTKLFFNKKDGRVLGAQMAGYEGVAKRIDVFATAIYNRMTVMDICQLDLSYTPPFAPVWDPVILSAMQAVKMVKKE